MRRLVLPCLVLPFFVWPFFAACSSDQAQAHSDPLKPPLGLEKVTLVPGVDNPLTVPKIELGKQLFFDPRLSNSGKMSCSSCHLPEKAFTDGRVVSPKDNGKDNTRNSPTMHNVGYLDRLYWDGRTATLEINVTAAWTGQLGGKPEEVATRLAAVPAYQKEFQDAFSAPPSEATIVKALASFLRTLRSGDSAWDRWQAGKQDAVGDAAKKGFDLFMTKAGCSVCHTPPLFTDKLFHNVGIGMTAAQPDIGAATEKGLNDPKMTGAFKTPTLRDIAKTAPYLHDGSAKTLAEVVKIMSSGGID
ncbi:MAG TPA: cytochrome c peroxidase, partial [Planctomycetota bacterium]|nr:cytochrome c peroxidase [Planctomycetota bacterium]